MAALISQQAPTSLSLSFWFIEKECVYNCQTEIVKVCVCDWESDNACVCVCDWQLICVSSVQKLRRVTGVKLKSLPLSQHHNPHLGSSSAGLPIKIQNGVCVWAHIWGPACVCVCVCRMESMGVFSPSISKQCSFEMWQLLIVHIITTHGWLALQSHKLNALSSIHPSLPPLALPFTPFFLIYLFIPYWRGKGWIDMILYGCLIKIYNSSQPQMIFASASFWSPIWEHLHLNWKARREIHLAGQCVCVFGWR